MAYTPINWQTGDTITADKLNKMDNGWAVESSSQQLFTETVTTTVDPEYPEDGAWGALAYSTLITADTLTVTFDGTDYTCPRIDTGDGSAYGGYSNGAPDFTDFPFAILSYEFQGVVNDITTASAGTYAVGAYATSSSIETSPAFETAVNSVVDTSAMPMLCVSGVTTWADMKRAYGSGRILFFRPYSGGVVALKYITKFTQTSVSYIPEDTQISVSITNGIFSVATV